MDQNAAACRWLVLYEGYPNQAISDAILIAEIVQQDAKEERVAMQGYLERGCLKYAQAEQFQRSPAQRARSGRAKKPGVSSSYLLTSNR